MFDRITVGPSRVDAHEHRALTDDSIRIYHELLEKARAEILQSFSHQNALLNFSVLKLATTDMAHGADARRV